ncbi:hypothetical protein CEXT_594541 [Caerostris extrusa]|uniref:Histone-lysine N-methyltransferase SETMAR n=1 Tax=Caerostris extrusa TaxID=172846 RepID=A0AAV4QMJ7_CAEEX|nr:hypothetical protein CEXT_594541 [Caerostris extrusa]
MNPTSILQQITIGFVFGGSKASGPKQWNTTIIINIISGIHLFRHTLTTCVRYVNGILRLTCFTFINVRYDHEVNHVLQGDIFQHDNGEPHTARASLDCFRIVDILSGPARTTDHEHVCIAA